MKKEPNEICYACGVTANYLTCLQKFGKAPKQKSFTVSTFHIGTCDICGEKKASITEARDFFYPDFSLIEKVKKLLYKKV